MAIVDISTITNEEFKRLNEAWKGLVRGLDPDPDIFAPDLKDIKPKSIDEFLYVMVSEDGPPAGYVSGMTSTSLRKFYGPLRDRLALDKHQYLKYDPSSSEDSNLDMTRGASESWLFIDCMKILKERHRYVQELIEHLKVEYPKTQIFYEPTSENEESELKKLGFKDTGWYITEKEIIVKGIVYSQRTPILCLSTPSLKNTG
jgi:hypothetical protein